MNPDLDITINILVIFIIITTDIKGSFDKYI